MISNHEENQIYDNTTWIQPYIRKSKGKKKQCEQHAKYMNTQRNGKKRGWQVNEMENKGNQNEREGKSHGRKNKHAEK